MQLTGRTVRVRVPATSANLGPGFDALGLALALYDEVEVRVGGTGLQVHVHGEGADGLPRDESNLLVRSLRRGLAELAGAQGTEGLEVSCSTRIPQSRGLGSSAGAIVAGLVAAGGLAVPGRADAADSLLHLATAIEGHPDNVAACLIGGLTLAWTDDGRTRVVRKEPVADLAATVFVPPFGSSTSEARGLLPAQVPYGDAVRNAARAALLLEALTHRPDLLLSATEDRLHQRYRAPAMPRSLELVDDLRALRIAAVLSGAGPSVLALTSASRVETVASLCPEGWRVLRLPVDRDGARVLPG